MSIDFNTRSHIPLPPKVNKAKISINMPTTRQEAESLAKASSRDPEKLEQVLRELLLKNNGIA